MGEKIQYLIRKRGLKQVHVEDRAGLPQNRISKWVSGKGQPTLKQAIAIARVLGCSVESLADETDGEALPEVADLRRRLLDAAEVVGYPVALRRVMVAPELPLQPELSYVLDRVDAADGTKSRRRKKA